MAASLETRVRRTGQRILKAMGAEKPAVFRQDTWAGKAILQCLGSEPFRIAFLRFLDVFPVLSSPPELSRHVQEYFGRPELAAQAGGAEREAETHGAVYLKLLEDLAGLAGSWPPLGSGTLNLDWGHTPKINISVKPSALYSQLRPAAFRHSVERAKERLREIYRQAMTAGARSPRRRSTVRLVKGAYWDAERVWAIQRGWPLPVYLDKAETDLAFERQARRLLENHPYPDLACAPPTARTTAWG